MTKRAILLAGLTAVVLAAPVAASAHDYRYEPYGRAYGYDARYDGYGRGYRGYDHWRWDADRRYRERERHEDRRWGYDGYRWSHHHGW